MKAALQGTSCLNKTLNKNARCVLPISVGWGYHENEYLESTIKCVKKNFDYCRIVVCDHLQRYSLGFFYPDKNLNEIDNFSIQLGDEWIGRNKLLVAEHLMQYKIERWTDWTMRRDYLHYKKKIETKIQNDAEFRAFFLKLHKPLIQISKYMAVLIPFLSKKSILLRAAMII